MTTTTPTPALADLDLDKLEALANAATTGEWLAERGMVSAAHPRSNDADGTTILATFTGYFDEQHANTEFCAAFNPDTAKKLIALARRAAQPVAPVQANEPLLALQDLYNLITHMGWKVPDESYHFITHAAAVIEQALAAASPQIAEVAELERIHAFLLGEKPINGLWFGDLPGVGHEGGKFWWRAQLSDAIAASRRAAGEPVAYVNGDELDNMLDDRTASIQGERSGYRATALYRHPAPVSAGQAEKVCGAFECKAGQRDGVTCAEGECDIDSGVRTLSASAGQAAPAVDSVALNLEAQLRAVVAERDLLRARLAFLPAEGAGQAGQVMIPRELLDRTHRVLSCAAICQIRDGERTWEDIGKLVAAPTERAAAPADQQQIEWSNDLQGRLIDLSQDMTESEDARQVMAEAACLLAALTGHAVSQ